MPRKTQRRRSISTRSSRFNEAAARCRGKLGGGAGPRAAAAASMRPRPDAAENGPPLAGHVGRLERASMRPRPDAAENFVLLDRPRQADRASMRPRPDAAENSSSSRSNTGANGVLQ